MGKRTTRKSKLNIKHEETKSELANHAKKLSNKTLTQYFSRAIPIFVLQIALLLAMLSTSKETGLIVGSFFICLDGFITLTCFMLLDAIPAWKMKKNSKDLQKNLTKNQIQVFYVALKARSIFRTLGNVIMTSIIFTITILVFVI